MEPGKATWVAVLGFVLPALCRAEATFPSGPEPQTRKFHYSPYEEASIGEALQRLGLALDESPEGKTVESIEPVRLEVIEPRDPAPGFLDVFHALTRKDVVARDVLLRPGETYRQTLADETQRNLAALPQFSLVLVLAAKGSAPGLVRVVVVTKDVWSLRLNWNIALANGGLESLTVDPSETNFRGTHQTLGLSYSWLPKSYAIGAQYLEPRLWGSHVSGFADAGLIFNTSSGEREGSFGALQLSLPLWSTLTRWSWTAGASWLNEVTRTYQNTEVASFTLARSNPCIAPSALCVPEVYESNVAEAAASLTRSFGWAHKQDVSLGLSAMRSRYTLPNLSGYDPATVAAFRAELVPTSDDRVGPLLQYHAYSTDHLRVLDLETLALQEDYRLGAEYYLRFYPVLTALGSSRNLAGFSAGVAETIAFGDGLARAGVEGIAEIETGSGQVSDGSLQTTVRLASPRLPAGRLVADGLLLWRYANYLNRTNTLGGDTRLRGYPSEYVVGADLLAVNAEYRSRPLELFHSMQLGGALFYDAGDAFSGWSNLYLWQAMGFGARILFPQLDRVVFRIDIGFPLARPLPAGLSPVTFFVTFDQAFPLYEVSPQTAATR
ncbi:MAG TPA: hypothetical protein VLV17_06420 [Anaeromyxobacteraceae bacterium]|nr:hypothetical protein [Anaeromyxobacteraceae bacterium]